MPAAIDFAIGPPPTLYVVPSWNLRASRLKSWTRVESTTSPRRDIVRRQPAGNADHQEQRGL